MKTRGFSLLALLSVSAFTLAAADVSGKWTAEVPGRDGNTMTNTFDLKAEGSSLSGTASTPRGEQAIANGKVDGNTITFSIVIKMGENERKINYTGQMSGDSIRFTRSIEGMDRKVEFTAKRTTT